MEVQKPKLVRVSKVTSNDRQPMVYLPHEVVRKTGLKKGRKVAIFMTSEGGVLLTPVEKIG